MVPHTKLSILKGGHSIGLGSVVLWVSARRDGHGRSDPSGYGLRVPLGGSVSELNVPHLCIKPVLHTNNALQIAV